MFETVRVQVDRLPRLRLLVQQMHAIGVESLWLVIVVGGSPGAGEAVRADYRSSKVVPLRNLGWVLLRWGVIGVGPVPPALGVGGGGAASIAAELGTMK